MVCITTAECYSHAVVMLRVTYTGTLPRCALCPATAPPRFCEAHSCARSFVETDRRMGYPVARIHHT
ncbi:hypothetical protein J6590_015004 [Homalodisca vitripennis]|nr:hypothetical protein J6590_015004 [Homalodisca vitripennis]